MTFSEVFERILAYWPENITISDGEVIPLRGAHEPTPDTAPSGGNPWCFPTLSKAWHEIEDKIDHHNDTWGAMMVWTMFQVFHEEAKRLREIGANTLITRSVDQATIEKKYFDNLHAEGWSEELAAYRRI